MMYNILYLAMNSVSLRYFFYILQIIEDMGMPKQELEGILNNEIAEIDVKSTEALGARVGVKDLSALLKKAELKFNDKHIGLHVSEKFRIAVYGYAGQIYAACKNTKQALGFSIKYSCLAHTIGKFEIVDISEPDGSLIAYTWKPSFGRDLLESNRQVTESIVSNYIQTIKWLTWELGECLVGVTFQHSAQEPIEEYSKVFGCQTTFNAAETSIILRRDILERPLPTHNPVKLALLEKKLNQLLAQYNMENDLIQRTKFVLHKIIQSQRPTLKSVARDLSMTDRTFKRYLKEQGTQFRDLLKEVKIELCDGYIKAGLSYPEIAQLLWYYDQSALTRAYKQWHGVAPSEHLR